MCLLNACYDNKLKTLKLFTVYVIARFWSYRFLLYRFPVGKTFVAKM